MVECKCTTKRSFSLRLSDLEKIERQAMQAGKEPLMEIEISGKRFYVMHEYTFDAVRADVEKNI